MFGHKRSTTIRQRAKLMGRMVMLLIDGLCTKSYDQFVERYSNPGDEPDENSRNARISRFALRFSPTCWYEATASLAENAQPWIFIEGAGDDCGVVISVRVPDDANVPSCPEVDLHVPRGAKTPAQWCAHCATYRAGDRSPQSDLGGHTVFALADAVMELAGSLSSDHCFWGQGGY
jgi:hypothetical protein